MRLIQLNVVSRNGVPKGSAAWVFDIEDVSGPITASLGGGSTLRIREGRTDLVGAAAAEDVFVTTYEVTQSIAAINAIDTTIIPLHVVSADGRSMNGALMGFSTKFIISPVMPDPSGSLFSNQERGNPGLVTYIVTESPATFISSSTPTAGWNLTGNTLAGTGILGSNNSQALSFITNGAEYMHVTSAGLISFPLMTPNTVPVLNGLSQFVSTLTTPTELGYVHGVTSSIQAQLNAAVVSSGSSNKLARFAPDGNHLVNSVITDDGTGMVGFNVVGPSAVAHIKGLSHVIGDFAVKVVDDVLNPLFFVQNDGTVGIRTSTPTAPLSIIGTTSGAGITLGVDGGSYNRIRMFVDSATETMNFVGGNTGFVFTNTASSIPDMLSIGRGSAAGIGLYYPAPPTNNVIIGKPLTMIIAGSGSGPSLKIQTPDAQDAVIAFSTSNNAGNRAKIFVDDANNYLNFSGANTNIIFLTGGSGTTERLRIMYTGEVGIGVVPVSGSGIQLALGGDTAVYGAGKGYKMQAGTDCKMDSGISLVAGTKTVNNASVTANSVILIVDQAGGVFGNIGSLTEVKTSRVAGTSFTVTSTNPLDTSTFAYVIFEPS